MGTGLTQLIAQSGYEVLFYDIDKQKLIKSQISIKTHLQKENLRNKLAEDYKTVLQRIHTTNYLTELKKADLIIEAIPEKMILKQTVFSELEAICRKETIFATNTSGLSITDISSVLTNPERLIGTHYFYPPPIMKLVELVRGEKTNNQTVEKVKLFLESMNKTWIEVKESPLFVFNRILIPMINEAIFVLEEGISSREEIDAAMMLGAHHPIGPLALADIIGLDTLLYVAETLYIETNNPKYHPADLLYEKVNARLLGKKTGEGFYLYEKIKAEA
ncbi:hypothetical protein ASG65_00540 [Bacillus sp. Leaf13]|nr:hypothetical protein ASG65_00540 [Bacillus sp. Leaf13]